MVSLSSLILALLFTGLFVMLMNMRSKLSKEAIITSEKLDNFLKAYTKERLLFLVEALKKELRGINAIPDLKFDMSEVLKKTDYGTVACVVGYAHLHGIGFMVNDNYVSFCEGTFPYLSSDAIYFIFSEKWHEYDNTLNGAIYRIEHLLQNNLEAPDEKDFFRFWRITHLPVTRDYAQGE